MADERRTEIKVGILIAAALAGAAGLLFLMDAFSPSGELLRADLSHSGGIPRGAPVRMAGVRVGRVRSVALLPERTDEDGRLLAVHMEMEIDREIYGRLHQGTRIEFATQGPLGEAYIELAQGDPKAPLLEKGAVLRAYPQRLDQLMPRLMDLMATLQTLAGEIDSGSVRTILGEVRLVAAGLRKFLEDQGGTIAGMVQRLDRITVSLEQLTVKGNRMLDKNGDLNRSLKDLAQVTAALKRDLPAMTSQAQSALANLDRLSASVTPEDMEALKRALRDAESASRKLNETIDKADRLMAGVDRIVSGVEQGRGSLGALVKDDALYEDLRALITELKSHPWRMLWKK